MGSRKAYFRRQMEKTTAFVSPSRYLADAYLRAGFDPRKMHVIWNGIDAEKYAEVKTEPAEKQSLLLTAKTTRMEKQRLNPRNRMTLRISISRAR